MLCIKIGSKQCDCVEWGRNWRLSCQEHVFSYLQNVQLLKIRMQKLLRKACLEKGPDPFQHGQSGCGAGEHQQGAWRYPCLQI